ncbi:MAG TPA: hypothetical protein ENI23_00635 [bacterium]|nr:hypothetical protein [bacterium]
MPQFFINIDKVSNERYDLAKFVEFVNDGFDPLTSKFLDDLKLLEVKGEYQVTVEVNKPDLVAHKIFNSTQFWWPILYYNSIVRPDELPPKNVLTFFFEEQISSLLFALKALDSESVA